MPSLSQMIDETKGLLQSWNAQVEQQTTLLGNMNTTDLTFRVASTTGEVTGIGAGIVEIDNELMYVTDVTANGTCTVAPWGRGYRSTVAASHAANSRITSAPLFPRAKITDAINQTLRRIFPDVFVIKTLETTAQPVIITYGLPDDAETVLSIKWQIPDGRLYWNDVKHYRSVSATGGTTYTPGGKSVDIYDPMMPGRPVIITYSAQPAPLANDSDDFETVTGLAGSISDVVTLGAAVSQLPAQELSRLQTSSIEQQNRSQLVAPSAALTSTRYLEQRFQTRLAEERTTLQRLYPARVVWQRR